VQAFVRKGHIAVWAILGCCIDWYFYFFDYSWVTLRVASVHHRRCINCRRWLAVRYHPCFILSWLMSCRPITVSTSSRVHFRSLMTHMAWPITRRWIQVRCWSGYTAAVVHSNSLILFSLGLSLRWVVFCWSLK